MKKIFQEKRDLEMNPQIESTLSALQKRHIIGLFAEDSEEAKAKILSLIPKDAVVGVGDSTANRQIGVLAALRERGTKVLNPFEPKEPDMDVEDHRRWRGKIVKEATLCDVFLTGTNAVTETGQLVNLDMIGNRICALTFGPKWVIVVVGRNKIAADLDEAMFRVKNYVAPINSMRLDKKTPCVKTSYCEECKSPERICNTWTITEKSFPKGRVKVVLINEDMGF